jgi:hypothetical protein
MEHAQAVAKGLEALRAALQQALGLEPDAVPEMGPQETALALENLRNCLERDDAQALDTFKQLQPALRRLLGEEAFRQVETALESFEMEQALELLQTGGAFRSKAGAG